MAAFSLVFSRFLYFRDSPLFEFDYFGEILVSISFFFFAYYLGRTIVFSIGGWFESVIVNSIRKAVNEVWLSQMQKNSESSSKKDKPKEVVDADDYIWTVKGTVLDTSAIIDGRILGVLKSGFLDGVLIVPQNVINELQFMADKNDKIKRDKGRRGLDVLKEIRKIVGKKRFKIADITTKPEEVDHSLVEFSKKYKTRIATVDFNLNKAAQVGGVEVLNINKLSNEIKLNVIPGEVLLVKLVQNGKEEDQGVGYLEDGTMIVVRNGSKFVGEHKEVAIEKVLQTDAGRMIFAVLK